MPKNDATASEEADQPLNQLGQKVGRVEIEEKLKQMRQKRLNRLSTFVNEQAKLSEQRNEQQQALNEEKREAESSTETKEIAKIKASNSEPDMFQKSGPGSRVTDLRSSFGKGGVFSGAKSSDPGSNKKNGPKLPSKIQAKPGISSKSLESPKSPTQKRKFFNSINCLTEEKKQDTDTIIEENDKMMNKIKQIQLKKVNISGPINILETPQNSEEIRKPKSPSFNRWKMGFNRNSDSSDFKEESAKIMPKKAIAVAPPKVDFSTKTQQPFSSRSKSDLHENWKSTKDTSITKNNSFKFSVKTASNIDLDSIIESVKRNSNEKEYLQRSSAERCSFTTFRTSKDSFTTEETKDAEKGKTNAIKRRSVGPVYATLEFSNSQSRKLPPKKEKTNYETIDFTKSLENKNEIENVPKNKNDSEIKTSRDDSNINFEKYLKEFYNSCKTLEEALKNKNPTEIKDIVGTNDLTEVNKLLNSLKIKIENSGSPNKMSPLFAPYREELSKLEGKVHSFKGLRRDLEYLVLSSHISKIYIDVKNIECPSKEHEKRRHSFLEKVNDLEKGLEAKLDKNENVLFGILEEQAQIIGARLNVSKMVAV